MIYKFKFAHEAAKVWMDEFRRTKGARQLILLYLANDVIQNGKRKGTVSEYIKAFQRLVIYDLSYLDSKLFKKLIIS